MLSESDLKEFGLDEEHLAKYTISDKIQIWSSMDALVRSIGHSNSVQWLASPSYYLEGEVPSDAIERGNVTEVCEAIEALRQGYFL